MRAIREKKRERDDERAMRVIRGERMESLEYDARIMKPPADSTALLGRRKAEGCLYCDEDGCRGCG